jgi:galactokinase
MQTAANDLLEQFQLHFGPTPLGAPAKRWHRVHVIRAPGRVNLIGEHTDYNEGFVFPMAIEPHIMLACRAREDGLVRLVSSVYPEKMVEFSVQRKIERAEPAWANYSRGVAAEMEAAGIPLAGMDCYLANTLAVGGGLSSSAALEVGTALALLATAGVDMDRSRLVLLCQKAEHEFAGVPVGIMDQTAVALGKEGHAMLLDCRDRSMRFIGIDPLELRVVVANTMVKHELTGGEYAKRRKECEQGVAYFRQINPAIKALRDVTLVQLHAAKDKLPQVVYRRCRHVITENARTSQGAENLAKHRYDEFGERMQQSHASLRDDYEVSCPELDFMVEQAMKVRGVYGARMTGGGFGGCIVALVQPRSVAPLIEHLRSEYQERFDIKPSIFATTATAGAGEIG